MTRTFLKANLVRIIYKNVESHFSPSSYGSELYLYANARGPEPVPCCAECGARAVPEPGINEVLVSEGGLLAAVSEDTACR